MVKGGRDSACRPVRAGWADFAAVARKIKATNAVSVKKGEIGAGLTSPGSAGF
jgi:hypothetical protein